MKRKSMSKLDLMAIAILLNGMVAFSSISQTNNGGGALTPPASSGNPFKTITNAKSGDIVMVDQTKKIVTLQDRNKKQIWVAEPVKEIQKNHGPITGKAEIRDIRFDDAGKNIFVTVGKGSSIAIDAKSGALSFQGSD